MNNDAFRKAAILISSLDPNSADALLEQMDPEQAVRIRGAIMEMDSPSEEEQHLVMQEFLGRETEDLAESDGGVELDIAFDRAPAVSNEPSPLVKMQPSDAARFCHLEEADVDSLAQLLRTEHPQTTAVVIAHLSPERAAEVIARLPIDSQTDVLLRVARMESTSPEVIRDIEEEMQALLANRPSSSGYSQQGLATVAAILEASPALRRTDLFAQLSGDRPSRSSESGPSTPGRDRLADLHNSDVNQELPLGGAHHLSLTGPADTADHHGQTSSAGREDRVTFAMLESLDNAALAAIIREADAQTAILALAGASHAFVQRILRGMPNRESRQLERKMQQLGPLRLVDVERAQATLAEIAERLVDDGKITNPATRRFAVAV